MSKKKIKTISKLLDGKCPLCGSELEYVGPREIDDNGSTVPWLCINCGATGNEGYTEVFDAHYKVHDRDGNEVTLESLPLEPVRDDDLLCEAGDTLDNAAHSLIVALSAVPVEWDMSLIAQVKDAVAGILKGRNIPVCIPWENEDEHICYSLPDERCAHCTLSCVGPSRSTIDPSVKRRSEELLHCSADNRSVNGTPETKTLYVTENCNAVYCSSIQVPIHMSLEEAIAYAEAHQEAIPLGVLDYVHGSSELDADNCSFE